MYKGGVEVGGKPGTKDPSKREARWTLFRCKVASEVRILQAKCSLNRLASMPPKIK